MFERKIPILHVSYSSSEDDADASMEGGSHLQRQLLHRTTLMTPTIYTLPDASITEREILSSDDDADVLSLRNTIKTIVKRALDTPLRESFERLRIYDSPSEEEISAKMKKMRIQKQKKTPSRIFWRKITEDAYV